MSIDARTDKRDEKLLAALRRLTMHVAYIRHVFNSITETIFDTAESLNCRVLVCGNTASRIQYEVQNFALKLCGWPDATYER